MTLQDRQCVSPYVRIQAIELHIPRNCGKIRKWNFGSCNVQVSLYWPSLDLFRFKSKVKFRMQWPDCTRNICTCLSVNYLWEWKNYIYFSVVFQGVILLKTQNLPFILKTVKMLQEKTKCWRIYFIFALNPLNFLVGLLDPWIWNRNLLPGNVGDKLRTEAARLPENRIIRLIITLYDIFLPHAAFINFETLDCFTWVSWLFPERSDAVELRFCMRGTTY